jgi:hypothetical protein
MTDTWVTKPNKPLDVNVVSKSANSYDPAPITGTASIANKDEFLPSAATRGT